VLLICFTVIFYVRHRKQERKIFVYAVPIKTNYGWGYDIMAGDRKFIQQLFIPAVSGKKGFKTSDDALLVGHLVVKKISSNQPPIITIRDLDSLGIVEK
jgi:hypothetical protein